MTDVLSSPGQPAPPEISAQPTPYDLFDQVVQERVDDTLRNYRSFAANEQASFEMRVLPNDQLHAEIETKLGWLLGIQAVHDEAAVTVETRHGIELNVFTRFIDTSDGPLAADRVYTTSKNPPQWFIEACQKKKPSPQLTMDGQCPDVGALLLALFED